MSLVLDSVGPTLAPPLLAVAEMDAAIVAEVVVCFGIVLNSTSS